MRFAGDEGGVECGHFGGLGARWGVLLVSTFAFNASDDLLGICACFMECQDSRGRFGFLTR